MDARTAALIVSAFGIMLGAAYMYRAWKGNADTGHLAIATGVTLTQAVVFFLALYS